MYYEDHGQGPVLFLLHGGGGDGSQFDQQIPFFAQHFCVIVPDACGQGRTSDRPGPWSYHAMAEDLATLMDQLDIHAADVMGWSDGGIVGLDLALHHPERVKRLVAFGANFRPDGVISSEVARDDTATGGGIEEGSQPDDPRLSSDASDVEPEGPKILVLWRTQPNFTLEELHRIRARTLIAAGEYDVIRKDHTEQLAGAIPGARLWIVPGASHDVILEQPDLVNRIVLDFLLQQ
jgi:pimeloyl-ACP methyl ester carboxylesterase